MLISAYCRDSKGVKLMRAMGWKPGFGIGPRKQVLLEKLLNLYLYSGSVRLAGNHNNVLTPG